MRGSIPTLLLISSVALAVPARAQLVLHPGALSTSGGPSNDETYTIFSSIGETAAGAGMSGGGFALSGGIVAIAATGEVPSLQHIVPDAVPANQAVQIVAQVDGSVRGATLYFRRGGESDFDALPMALQDGEAAAVVPDSTVGSRGVTYFILVEDELGRMFRMPAIGAFSLRVQVEGEGLVRDVAQPSGNDQGAYRLVSIPIQADDPAPEVVLADDLGPYDPMNWRFFGLDFDQEYEEFPDVEALEQGRGYWLITSEPGRVIDTGAGTSAPTDEPFMVLLHPRWNLIGTPFDFPIPIAQTGMTSGRPFAPRSLEDGWNDPIRNPVRTLRPFEGYAVFNDLQRVDTLLINPHPTDTGNRVVQAAAKTAASESMEEWTLHISAETATSRDVDNALGIRSGALETFDATDLPEPPTYGEFVSVYFLREDWQSAATHFSTDFRNPSETGHTWDLVVQGGKSEIVDLRFEEIEAVPSTQEVWLVDEWLEVAVNLRERPRYQIATAGSEPHTLKLLVGSPEYVAKRRPAASELPTRLTVTDVFPNPFSSAASIRYVLPESGAVRIGVYNAVGAEVAKIVEGESRAAGAHLAVWDGRGISGAHLPSGVYFIRLTAGSSVHTAKVVFIR